METPTVVNLEEPTILPEENGFSQPGADGQEDPQAPIQAGDKTSPNLLLKSLREEREKNKALKEREIALEEELNSLKSSILSDADEATKSQFNIMQSELSDIKTKLAEKEVIEAYPVLKDNWTEFDEFRTNPENKGLKLKTAAKAFLTEKELLTPARKGLEPLRGGIRQPVSLEMTADDVKTLRETNFRKYQQMLKEGKIKI